MIHESRTQKDLINLGYKSLGDWAKVNDFKVKSVFNVVIRWEWTGEKQRKVKPLGDVLKILNALEETLGYSIYEQH